MGVGGGGDGAPPPPASAAPEQPPVLTIPSTIIPIPHTQHVLINPPVTTAVGPSPSATTVISDHVVTEGTTEGTIPGVAVVEPLSANPSFPAPPPDDFDAPPAYETLGKLPTYEEAEALKRLEEQGGHAGVGPGIPLGPHHHHHHPRRSALPMVNLDQGHGSHGGHLLTEEERDTLLGTDFIFCLAFIISFMFSWMGFLVLICCCQTIAGRYGALAGFGLSLAKWTMIVQHKNTTGRAPGGHGGGVAFDPSNLWLWWLLVVFGILIFIRATFQYFRIKREWTSLPRYTQERLLFFH